MSITIKPELAHLIITTTENNISSSQTIKTVELIQMISKIDVSDIQVISSTTDSTTTNIHYTLKTNFNIKGNYTYKNEVIEKTMKTYNSFKHIEFNKTIFNPKLYHTNLNIYIEIFVNNELINSKICDFSPNICYGDFIQEITNFTQIQANKIIEIGIFNTKHF